MEIKTIAELLQEVPLTEGMQPEHLALLAGCAVNKTYPEGTYLFREGSPADYFYVIRSGKVALEVYSAPGGARTVDTVGQGEVLGWSWIFPPYRYLFDARVLESARTFTIDGACLRGKAEEDPAFGYELMKRMAAVFTGRLTAARLQLLDLYGRS